LGTLPVVGLGDGAVVIMRSGLLVSSPVSFVEHLSVIEIEEVELIFLGGRGGNKGNEDGKWGEFHLFNINYYINVRDKKSNKSKSSWKFNQNNE
jgi:hypothetical protein